MGLHHTKLEEMARVSLRNTLRGNSTKEKAKSTVAAGTNSLSTTNEKRKINAQRDFLKRKRPQPEHNSPKHHVEVGISDSTGYRLTISLSTAAAYISPPQRIPQRGQERCWRGIGDRNPLSLSNRPREEQIKSTHTMWYSALVKPEKRSKYNAAYLISPAGNQYNLQ